MDKNWNQFIDIKLVNQALKAGNTGLWKISINTKTKQQGMYCDETMIKLLGLEHHLSPEECFSWWFERISTIDAKNYVNKTVEYAFTNNKTIEVDYYWNHPILGCIYVRCGGTPTEPDGDFISIMGYHQNIDELQNTKKILQKHRINLKMACQLGNMAVFELGIPQKYHLDHFENKELCILTVDELFSNIFNVDIAESIDIIWPKIAENMLPAMQKIWNDLLVWQNWEEDYFVDITFIYKHKQKKVYWLSLTCKSFLEAGKFRIVGYITNITEKKEHELSLQKAKKNAEAANLSKSLFLTNMSHEIRTPMHAVINFTKLLMATGLNEVQNNYISKIVYSSKRMMSILNDILDFASIDSHKMKIIPSLFCVQSEMDNMCELAVQLFEKKKIQFTFAHDKNIPPYLMGDALRIRQILINLLSNAYKFTASGAINFSIELISRVDDDIVIKFIVKDTGIGISKDEQEPMFTAFRQSDLTSTRLYGGIGLGLSISNMLVKLMGGTISVESQLGVGSSFYFEIPLKVAPSPCITLKQDTKEKMSTFFTGIRCLIVEDNLINQEILATLLESLDIETKIVNNGQEALDCFYHDQDFDCIFMDIQMPVMDGYTATSMIRQSPYNKAATIPIIAVTANTMHGEDVKSINSGMNVHLTKPLELKTIVKILEELGLSQSVKKT